MFNTISYIGDDYAKISSSVEELRTMFEDVKRETNDFTKFSPEVLFSNSNRIVVFRLALGMTQWEFGKLCDRHLDTISQHERFRGKKMEIWCARRFIEIVQKEFLKKNLIGNIFWQQISDSFNKFRRISSFEDIQHLGAKKVDSKFSFEIKRKWGTKGAIKSFKKRALTSMEQSIFNRFTRNGIDVQKHFILENREIDFAILNRKQPIFIEAINKSMDLLKISKLRIRHPNSLFIAILNKRNKNNILSVARVFNTFFMQDEINLLIDDLTSKDGLPRKRCLHTSIIDTRNNVRALNNSEMLVKNMLEKGFGKVFTSQVKINFKINRERVCKVVDFVLPNNFRKNRQPIFLEVKFTKKNILRTLKDLSIQTSTLKSLFPNSFIIGLVFNETKHALKLDGSVLRSVGLDELTFCLDELTKIIERCLVRDSNPQVALPAG